MSETEKQGVAESTDAWPTVLYESFATAPEGWSFAATSSTPPLKYDVPGLMVTLPGGETSVAAYWYERQQFGDASISVTVSLVSAQEPTQSYCGISFRARSDRDNYRLFVDGEGFYRLTRRMDNVSTALVDWTRAEALLPGVGASNKIQVMVEGPLITVYANGVKLTQVRDDTFLQGHVALQAQGGSSEVESATVFVFRDMEISAP